MFNRGPKVLVVDDDPSWVELMRDVLESEGFTVAVADERAVALEQHARFHPFVVITDLRMPVSDGRSLLSRSGASDGRVPVIVVTADRARVSPGLPGAFRVIGKAAALEGVLSAVADASEHLAARPRARAGKSRLLAELRAWPHKEKRWSRVRGVVSSTLSRVSSTRPRRLVLTTLVVMSSIVVLGQLASRFAHAA